MSVLGSLFDGLNRRGVRYVVIGVWAINLYAQRPDQLFATQDCDALLPLDPVNLLTGWEVCEEHGLELFVGAEPLDRPRDRLLADRVVSRRATQRAASGSELQVDFTLEMSGFTFHEVWSERRTFRIEGVDVPVARLSQIVRSKAAAGREKDRLFLATHADALRDLLRRHEG